MPNLTSQLCGDLQLADCLSTGDGAIQRSPQHMWTFDRTQKQGAAKAARVTFSTDTCLIF